MNLTVTLTQALAFAASLVLTSTTALAENAAKEQNLQAETASQPVQIGIWDSLNVLDPASSTIVERSVAIDALFSGLVTLDKEKGIVPAQASSWTISPDGKRYEFKLRDDIFWTDKKPVTAQDFVLAFKRILDPQSSIFGHASYMLIGIKNATKVIKGEKPLSSLGVSAPDDKTLVIELETPASYFLEILDVPALAPVPSHMLEKYGDDWWKQMPFVSNGDYRLVDINHEKAIELELIDKQRYPLAPRIVEFIPVLGLDAAASRLVSGTLDLVWDLRKEQTNWMESQTDMRSFVSPLPLTTYTIFNTASPKLSDKRIREALNLVIDRPKFAESEQAELARTLAPPSMMADVIDQLGTPFAGLSYAQRVEAARKLMRKAGYGPQNPLNINLAVLDRRRTRSIADGLRAMFSQIWVNATIKVFSVAGISSHVRSSDMEMSIEYWVADYNDAMAFYSLYKSDSSRNLSKFSNPQYDELIDKALLEQDAQKRQPIYAKLESILREEIPVIPLSHGNFLTMVSPRIKDSGFDTLFLSRLLNLRLASQSVGE